jgi:hypothetical protein
MMSCSTKFTVTASLRLRQILSIVQIDRRVHALQAAIELRNLSQEAYLEGLEDFGDAARRAEIDAVRWRNGDDAAEARVRIARAVKTLLTLLDETTGPG